MTAKTMTALAAEIASLLANNTSGDITPADIRTVCQNIADSVTTVTGWADYVDTTHTEGSPQALSALTEANISIDAGTIRDSYLPTDGLPLYTPESLGYDALTEDFVIGDTVTGGTSGATAEIRQVSKSGTAGRLFLGPITGTFTDNETITGTSAGSADADGSNGTGRILGEEGASLLVTLDFKAKPTNANTTYLEDWIDIGGAVGELYRRIVSFPKGNGVERPITHTTMVYTLDTWELNGGELLIEAVNTCDIYDKRVVIAQVTRP